MTISKKVYVPLMPVFGELTAYNIVTANTAVSCRCRYSAHHYEDAANEATDPCTVLALCAGNHRAS